MKRILKIIFYVTMLLGMITIAASAEDAAVVPVGETIIIPYTADNVPIVASDGSVYTDPAYYSLTYNNSSVEAGQQYIVLMAAADLSGDKPVYTITEDSLIYINQTASESGKICFDKVYPSRLTDSVILISGQGLEESPVIVGTVKVNEDAGGMLGDVNGDLRVNAIDAQQILKYSAGLIKFNSKQMIQANVNGDAKVNAVDAQWILRYAAGIVDKFPSN